MSRSFVLHCGFVLLVSLPSLGCFRGPAFMKQEGTSYLMQKSNVITIATQEANGVISASLSAGSNATQAVQVGSSGVLAGSGITFPPGSLALDTSIDIQEGASLSTSVTAQELGLSTTFATSGAAVVVTSSVPMDAAKPFTIAIPLPTATGLLLGMDLTNLIVLYKVDVVATGKTVIGIIPKSELKVEGGVVTFATKFFGAFQAAVTESTVAEAKEAPTTQPITNKNGESVSSPSVQTVAPPAISYSPAAHSLLTGSAITPIVATNGGGAIESCTSDQPLPAGLTLGADCKISGTPTTPQSATDYAVTASNAGGKSAPFVVSLAIAHPAPTFTGLSPGTGSILGGATLTLTGSGFQSGVTVKLNTNMCAVTSVTASQITCTTPADSEGIANILIQNPDGQSVSIPSGFAFINHTVALQFAVMPPSTAVTNSPMANFTVRTVREDGSPDTAWAHPAAITPHQYSDCSDIGPGTIAASASITSYMPSGGAWNYTNVSYNRKHYLYFKVSSGGLSVCSPAPVAMAIGACHPSFAGIIESEGNPNLDYIATCRRPTASTNDISFSTATSAVCNVGWHTCYPSEYSDIMRANLNVNEITTNSNTTFLNAEGTLNDGSSPLYWNNNSSVNCASKTGERVMAGAHYWSGWTVYESSSICTSDASFPDPGGVTSSSWRPQGYRFMFTNPTSSGDGAVCCRNTGNPHFSCASKATEVTCNTYASACMWNAGTSTCEPL